LAPFLRRGRALLFAEDFAGLLGGPAESGPAEQRSVSQPPGEALWERLAPRVWRRARRAAERAVGEQRLGRLLHPWKARVRDLAWAADAAESALRGGNSPLPLAPLLPPSVRAEKERLDALAPHWRSPAPASRDKPRALLVLPWIVHGGAERAVLDMAAALAADGWELIAATHVIANHDWERRLLAHVGDLYLLGETTPPPQQQALVEIARGLSPDVVFLVHSWLGLESLAALREALPRLRTVDYQHTDYQIPGGNFARVSCERHDANLDRRAVSTEYLMSRYREYGIKPEKVRVIRAGCDEAVAFNPALVARGAIRAQLAIPESAPLVGFVGRFVPEKDPLFVLRTFAALDAAARAKGAASLQLVMVGEGTLLPEARDLAGALQLSKRVHFLPANTAVAEVLRDLDLLLMASRIEGLPLVFFESLSLETPVVSTAIEGIPELIDESVGACVPDVSDPGDRMRALVTAALPLVIDPARRKAAGLAGRRRVVERFPAAGSRKAWAKLFRELLESRN
jgi:glycosyltransferase involved in cell wall biosynthesis